MKIIKVAAVLLFLFSLVHIGRAQKTSGKDMKFDGWYLGKADIVAISVFADDFEKHRKKM